MSTNNDQLPGLARRHNDRIIELVSAWRGKPEEDLTADIKFLLTKTGMYEDYYADEVAEDIAFVVMQHGRPVER